MRASIECCKMSPPTLICVRKATHLVSVAGGDFVSIRTNPRLSLSKTTDSQPLSVENEMFS